MENQKSTSKQIMLTYGVYFGFASILLAVGIYALGMIYEQGLGTALISFVIMAVITFLGLKKFRDEGNGGFLSLGQALKIGLGIALIGAIISILYNQIFVNFIEPDYTANMMKIGQEQMLEQNPNMTDEQFEAGKAMQEKFSTPLMGASLAIIVTLFFGFIISLIEGLILKRTEEDR